MPKKNELNPEIREFNQKIDWFVTVQRIKADLKKLQLKIEQLNKEIEDDLINDVNTKLRKQ